MNTSPICFGARDNSFGSFVVPSSGKLASVRLVHLYGYVTCDKRNRAYWSFWGCGHYPEDVNVVITTSADNILFPSNEFFTGLGLKRSSIPGYNSLSPELVLWAVSNPPNVAGGQELRLWYGPDLANSLEGNNGGTSCCHVYVRLI
ncbi:unnamed protein product [Porites evermanni]|uniref:Uncharacterized protein n=1 Tax=Porites evermanni TaxID=104178 RepID=A0ABN8SKG4_9CNID|nr:unnamed protein product [Porites evermanni]